MDATTKQYARRDTEELGEHYWRHIVSMTTEGLHDKYAIAAELAWRDAQIESLSADARAADLILKLLSAGLARFEPATKEFCVNGLRYSAREGDWGRLISVIGWDRARGLLSQAEGSNK